MLFLFKYLHELFVKADPDKPTNFNIKAMHWINRVAIILFLVCLAMILFKLLN